MKLLFNFEKYRIASSFYAVFFRYRTESVIIAVLEEDTHPLIDPLNSIALSAGFGSAAVITQLLPFTFPADGAAVFHLSHGMAEKLHHITVPEDMVKVIRINISPVITVSLADS